MTHLVIREAPGGCRPATLHCCVAELAMWTLEAGARCAVCGNCYTFATPPSKPVGAGIFVMVRGPDVPALYDWVSGPNHPPSRAARTGD